MKIRFNETGYIAGYVAGVGDMEGAVEWAGEIPDGFDALTCRFYRREGDVLVFDAEKQRAEEAAKAAQEEIGRLQTWLDDYYDKQVSEYLRCQRRGEPYDKDIAALDDEAEAARLRIRELRDLLISQE